MVFSGHVQNGLVVPDGAISLPEGTEVSIIVHSESSPSGDSMSPEERQKYLEALARIDAVTNENPGDAFSGTDHDLALYGDTP